MPNPEWSGSYYKLKSGKFQARKSSDSSWVDFDNSAAKFIDPSWNTVKISNSDLYTAVRFTQDITTDISGLATDDEKTAFRGRYYTNCQLA